MVSDRYTAEEINDEYSRAMYKEIFSYALEWHEENREADKAEIEFGENWPEVLEIIKKEILKMEPGEYRGEGEERRLEKRKNGVSTWEQLKWHSTSIHDTIVKKMGERASGITREKIESLFEFLDTEKRQKGEVERFVKKILPQKIEENKKTTIKSIVRIRKEVRDAINTDHLTGAFSKLGIEDQFASSIKELNHNQEKYRPTETETAMKFRCMAVAMFDLNSFKRINDAKTHQVGDKVLIATVEALKKSLRNSDIIGRQSGDEFTIILPDVEYEVAKEDWQKATSDLEKQALKDAAASKIINKIFEDKVVKAVEQIEIIDPREEGKTIKKGEVSLTGGVRIIHPGDTIDYKTIGADIEHCTMLQKEQEPGKFLTFSPQIEEYVRKQITDETLRRQWVTKKVVRIYKRRMDEAERDLEEANTTIDLLAATELIRDLKDIMKKEEEIMDKDLKRKLDKAISAAIQRI